MHGVGRVGGTGRAGVAARGAARGGGFSVGPGNAGGTRETAAAAGVAAPGLGLLALQEAGSGAGRDADAHRRASNILAELEGLQRDLLDGTTDPRRLHRLAALDASGEEGSDPTLRDAVQGIVLRARVELARRGLHVPETLS